MFIFRIVKMKYFYFLFLFFCCEQVLLAQSDTTKKKLPGVIKEKAINEIIRKPPVEGQNIARSEDAYMPFEGKIVRNIYINHIGFEKSIYDSSKYFKNLATKVANALHTNTREEIIRHNLFIKKNKPLNPYRLADNERYLRDLDFILDSKIEICDVDGTEDSVDIEIYTRDVFSIGFRIDPSKFNVYEFNAYDANLFGYGQRLQVNTLWDARREPRTGYEFYYRKNSVAGSLINATVGYTQINNGRSYGEENEHALYLRLDRPLVSPYSRLAGGFELSKNYAVNDYQIVAADFRKYNYVLEDVWVGYNMGIRNTTNNRKRHFLAARYFNQTFSTRPNQLAEQENPLYNSQRYFLTSLTFYEQNFYETNFIYGFGRTEDVPYGYKLTFTTGWASEFGVDRMYSGASVSKDFITPIGNIFSGTASIGSFRNGGKNEDGFLTLSVSYFSKLYNLKGLKSRGLIEINYAQAMQNRFSPLLTLNNQLNDFTADSLFLYRRLVLNNENTLFTKWKLGGFRVACFANVETALVQQDVKKNLWQDFYFGLNGGLRIRNENVIFGTIELRAFVYPKTVPGVDVFSVRLSTNVRLKYSGQFVRPPEFIRYN